MLGDVKVLSDVIPSGSPTSSGVLVGGYGAHVTLQLPVMTSALLVLAIPHTGVTLMPLAHTAGPATIATPGGTGGVAVNVGPLLGGYSQVLRLSAAAAQAADRTLTWYFRGG